MPYLDILLIALVAGFILLRLRSVLGEKTGFEDSQPRPTPLTDDTPMLRPREVPSPEVEDNLEKLEPSIRSGVEAIKKRDAEFSVAHFMQGAKGAFDMLFDAFAKGDKPVLKMLLSPELYDTFAKEIDARATQTVKTETTLVAIREEEMKEASLEGSVARIRVRFVSEQIHVQRDASGVLTGGNPSQSEHVEDEWVFERDLSARSPNWKIIET